MADKSFEEIDKVVAKIKQKISDGEISADRVLALLGFVLKPMRPMSRDYLVHANWSWDNFHNEYGTLGLEACDEFLPYEKFFDPSTSSYQKEKALGFLKPIIDNLDRSIWGKSPIQNVFKILQINYSGFDPSLNFGTVNNKIVDIHLVLQPVFQIIDGNPKPYEKLK